MQAQLTFSQEDSTGSDSHLRALCIHHMPPHRAPCYYNDDGVDSDVAKTLCYAIDCAYTRSNGTQAHPEITHPWKIVESGLDFRVPCQIVLSTYQKNAVLVGCVSG